MKKEQKEILIAEDEKPMAHAMELKLTKAGFKVTVVNDGQAVIDQVATKAFDLILLDLMMPKLNGFGVLEQLQKKDNKTPILVTSNLGQEEDANKSKSLGAAGYFIKSNTPIQEIVDHIKKTLQEK